MIKKIALWHFLLLLLVITTVSCSSSDKPEDGTPADVAEATADPGVDGGDQAAADGAAANPDDQGMAPQDGQQAQGAPETSEGDIQKQGDAPPGDVAQNGDPNAQPPQGGDAVAPGTESSAADAPPAGGTNEFADNGAPPADGSAPPADANAAPPADGGATPPADQGQTPAPETAQNDSAAPPADNAQQGDLFGAGSTSSASTGSDSGAAGGDAPAPKKHLALAHIKDAPFKKGGQLLNTVYIARDGDTLESISQKLFNEDKSKMLKKANPALKKGVKPGDKVYFNSPNRAEDADRMMTVYEDQGIPPSTYTTKDGDTLKSLAKEWYGSEASYKEIYAINKSLTSTKDLPPGTELQYWPSTVSVAAYGAKPADDVAKNEAPPSPASTTPPMMGGNNSPGGTPPGMAAGMANNNMAPPPPPGGPGMPGAPGVPGGPDMNAAPPPPPPPPPAMTPKHKKELAQNPMDKDTIMYAAAAGILLIGSGILIAIRRRNSRRNSGITQV